MQKRQLVQSNILTEYDCFVKMLRILPAHTNFVPKFEFHIQYPSERLACVYFGSLVLYVPADV